MSELTAVSVPPRPRDLLSRWRASWYKAGDSLMASPTYVEVVNFKGKERLRLHWATAQETLPPANQAIDISDSGNVVTRTRDNSDVTEFFSEANFLVRAFTKDIVSIGGVGFCVARDTSPLNPNDNSPNGRYKREQARAVLAVFTEKMAKFPLADAQPRQAVWSSDFSINN